MHRFQRSMILSICIAAALGATMTLAQRPQDNWYLEKTWTKTGGGLVATNGGLSQPYGVAIGPDGRVYVGDQGYLRIQVYQSNGDYDFSITNNFGEGLSFSQPRGMIFGPDDNLYVADYTRNAVFVFDSSGNFVGRIGGSSGSGDGQLSGPIDVALGPDEEVYVLESANSRVSVFGKDGVFKRKWGAPGGLTGQLSNPTSIAAANNGMVYIAARGSGTLKVFNRDGVFLTQVSGYEYRSGGYNQDTFEMILSSVRLDPTESPSIVVSQTSQYSHGGNVQDHTPYCQILNRDLSELTRLLASGTGGQFVTTDFSSQCHAVGRDGTVVMCSRLVQKLWVYRLTFRDQPHPMANAIPLPAVWRLIQRPESPIVDIDYRVTDMDDETVTSAMLIFTNTTQTLANCLRFPTYIEGTSGNLGSNIAANITHRLTWNAGADWSTSLGSFRVAVLAKDSREKLLDIHYLDLPAEYGMPALRISRSPLIESDFAQVWWWLLATGDSGIRLTSGKVYGQGGSHDGTQLWDGTTTSAAGRSYLLETMGLRQVTAAELTWAKQASTVPTVEQWNPTRTVAGRPKKVNEYGFDTGDWGVNAWWVAPLD